MNLIDVLRNGDSDVRAEAVLVIYKNYIEIADVDHKERIGAFRPIKRETLARLSLLTLKDTPRTIIEGEVPKNVKYISFGLGTTRIVFTEPKANKRIIVDNGEHIHVDIPNLLFDMSESKLHAYAYKGRLIKSTKLYSAPFSNISSGSVCLGTIKVSKSDNISKTIKNMSDVFWNSQFEMSKETAIKKIQDSFIGKHLKTYKELIE